MIFINEVYLNANNNEYIRIIDLDNEADLLYFVICFKTYAHPRPYQISVFCDEVDNKFFIKVPDMFQKFVDEEALSKREVERRELYWEIVDRNWKENKDKILSRNKCNGLYKSISVEYKISLSTVKRIFSSYFERGMNKNSLLSRYPNSGGKGKQRKLGLVKVGRPKKYGINEKSGINITEDIKILFQMGLEKHYYKKKNSLSEAYIAILRESFSYKYYENGEMKYTLFPEDELPTYHQFYYWFTAYKDETKNIIERLGNNYFNLNKRPILSNSNSETIGPGTRFQVDATVADVYLVLKSDRNRIIGRPVVYAVRDVFSRLVTGIYVGLEGPSWIGAMMALDNMIADKVEFCKEYGINIDEEEWPAHHLPEIILADRGEFEGNSPENLMRNLGIFIENTPPYRGDLKGIIERSFRTLNIKIKHKTPGAIMKEYRQRGDKDYRLDATLTLEEFYKIYIRLVLYHNTKIIEKYPLDIDLITAGIAPVPLKLWNWGLEYGKGRLKDIDREIFRLNLLPKAKASVSRSGIRFEGRSYSCQKAVEEQWFIKNKIRSINIVYDPRKLNYIYILNDDGKTYEKCYLLDISHQFKDVYLEELIFLKELNEELSRELKHDNLQKNSDCDKFIEDIVKKAKKEKKKSTTYYQSNAAKLGDIRKNRMLQKQINRELEGFELDKQPKIETTIIPKLNSKIMNQEERDPLFDLLDKMGEE
jgi:hypothetical protein